MKKFCAVHFLLLALLAGCTTFDAEGLVGEYRLDTSHCCSNANQITMDFARDGSVHVDGSAPGLIDENGVEYSWTRDGSWRVEGGLVKVVCDGEEEVYKPERYRGDIALYVYPYTLSRRELRSRYLRFANYSARDSQANR